MVIAIKKESDGYKCNKRQYKVAYPADWRAGVLRLTVLQWLWLSLQHSFISNKDTETEDSGDTSISVYVLLYSNPYSSVLYVAQSKTVSSAVCFIRVCSATCFSVSAPSCVFKTNIAVEKAWERCVLKVHVIFNKGWQSSQVYNGSLFPVTL